MHPFPFRIGLLALSIVLVSPPSAGQGVTPITTTPVPLDPGSIVLAVRINGVSVNLANCTISLEAGLNCSSNPRTDVAVTRVGTTGTETWVIALLVVNLVLVLVVGGVAVASYIARQKQLDAERGGYGQVPEAPPMVPGAPEPPPYGYPPNGYPGYPPRYAPPTGGTVSRKVIGVGLIRPCEPA